MSGNSRVLDVLSENTITIGHERVEKIFKMTLDRLKQFAYENALEPQREDHYAEIAFAVMESIFQKVLYNDPMCQALVNLAINEINAEDLLEKSDLPSIYDATNECLDGMLKAWAFGISKDQHI